MAWAQKKIEIELKRKLDAEYQHNQPQADQYFGYYTSARSKLLHDDIYNSIRTIRKGLSDHGENHIMNVLDNAFELLVHRKYDTGGELKTEQIDYVDSIQLYFICVLILFHDVGNLIADRKKHHEQDIIREIYNYVRKRSREFDDEQILIPEVASKHSGTAVDGSKDTIAELGVNLPYLFDKKIYTKKMRCSIKIC